MRAGRYGGGAGLTHRDPLLSLAWERNSALPDSELRGQVAAAAEAAVRDHARAPQVEGCTLPPTLEGATWEW